jgi:hypothetical protein
MLDCMYGIPKLKFYGLVPIFTSPIIIIAESFYCATLICKIVKKGDSYDIQDTIFRY